MINVIARQQDHPLAMGNGLLEPAIIVALGGVIAVIVLSILLPILQFNTLVIG